MIDCCSNTNLTFYDPVHGLSLIPCSERGLQSLWQDPEKHHYNNNIFSICDTLEFKRLHFLRQAGFCFQSYPSATHSRFGHSVGTCHLGRVALDQVDIKINNNSRIKLGSWLKNITTKNGTMDFRDEFLLALLLHDVGHFPFSHVLENNPHLREIGFPNHEEIAVDMIMGNLNNRNQVVKAYDVLFGTSLAVQIGAPRLYNLLKNMESNRALDLRVLAYLICHTRREEISNIISDPVMMESLELLGHLVSGVVDIDRLDHYIRDLFFTGTAVSSFNVFKLLNAIYLNQNDRKVYIDDDAIPQAFNLLHSKEHLRRYIFENPKNMAFNAMLNYCVSSYIKADRLQEITCKYNCPPKTLSELLTLTDGQLLSELELVNKPSSISKMVSLIRMGVPYQLLDSISTYALNIGQSLEQRAEYMAGQLNLNYLEDELPKAIFLLQDSKGKVSLLSMDKLFFINKNGRITPLVEADGFEYFIRHLSFESENVKLKCWVFIRPGLKEDDVLYLKKILSTLSDKAI